jgi:hypothetical protein
MLTVRWHAGASAAKKLLIAGLVATWVTDPCRAAGVLDPQGPVGAAERLILLNATGIMLVVSGSLWIMANLNANMLPMPVIMDMQR